MRRAEEYSKNKATSTHSFRASHDGLLRCKCWATRRIMPIIGAEGDHSDSESSTKWWQACRMHPILKTKQWQLINLRRQRRCTCLSTSALLVPDLITDALSVIAVEIDRIPYLFLRLSRYSETCKIYIYILTFFTDLNSVSLISTKIKEWSSNLYRIVGSVHFLQWDNEQMTSIIITDYMSSASHEWMSVTLTRPMVEWDANILRTHMRINKLNNSIEFLGQNSRRKSTTIGDNKMRIESRYKKTEFRVISKGEGYRTGSDKSQ